ncbi:hypothetical protein Tco_1122836 [Tanacetum coccineum]|uniref:Uncharacterized protein n=1 Tax=Tanacetum coccineum TaxID=301880 RepID=A0ABQ5J267_9ASTR
MTEEDMKKRLSTYVPVCLFEKDGFLGDSVVKGESGNGPCAKNINATLYGALVVLMVESFITLLTNSSSLILCILGICSFIVISMGVTNDSGVGEGLDFVNDGCNGWDDGDKDMVSSCGNDSGGGDVSGGGDIICVNGVGTSGGGAGGGVAISGGVAVGGGVDAGGGVATRIAAVVVGSGGDGANEETIPILDYETEFEHRCRRKWQVAASEKEEVDEVHELLYALLGIH